MQLDAILSRQQGVPRQHMHILLGPPGTTSGSRVCCCWVPRLQTSACQRSVSLFVCHGRPRRAMMRAEMQQSGNPLQEGIGSRRWQKKKRALDRREGRAGGTLRGILMTDRWHSPKFPFPCPPAPPTVFHPVPCLARRILLVSPSAETDHRSPPVSVSRMKTMVLTCRARPFCAICSHRDAASDWQIRKPVYPRFDQNE